MQGEAAPEALARFHPAVAEWFRDALGEPTLPQTLGWPPIAAGKHTLVTAPTGSGKTLTAFLWALDRLFLDLSGGHTSDGVDVLYVSPLKALNADVERNLQAPLEGIRALDTSLPEISVGVRSGDTTSSERQRLIRRPPHILITTPESLYLYLTSKRSRPTLRNVRTVIIDEIHAIHGSKRGVHLALSLERLAAIAETDQQRVGLSATVNPLDAAARFLGGANRPVEIVDASTRRGMHLEVVGPDFDAGETVWDEIVDALLADIESHTSTLIFVNNRASAEKLVVRLNEAADKKWDRPVALGDLARAHHGSVSHEVRAQIEDDLKSGRLPCLVATGTLELGIDMGAIDLVCQVESPKSVSRGVQRVGRSGHLVDATSVGHIYPLYRTDVAEVAALAQAMLAGDIEKTQVPVNCLDVLAQQVVAEASAAEIDRDEMYSLVRRAQPYVGLSREAFDATLGMLAGEVRDPDLAVSKPRIIWDRKANMLRARPGAPQVAVQSGGTIPDRGLYPVYLAGSDVRLGDLDEEFVFESKPGDVFALGTSLWRVLEIGRDRVIVSEAPGSVPRMPFWRGEGLGRPFSLGRAMGALLRDIEAELAASGNGRAELEDRLVAECTLDPVAARALVSLVEDQRDDAGVPTDRRVIVEAFTDEVGDWRVVLHSIFGMRTNMAWAMALVSRIRERLGLDVESVHTDDGVMLRFPNLNGTPPADLLDLVSADRLEDLVTRELANTALYASRFRENAQRALLLPRNRPGTRTPLWLQRLRAADLMTVAERDPEFPIVIETYRECLDDVLDVAGLRKILSGVEAGEIELHYLTTPSPSPFAAGMIWRFVFDYLYQGDVPAAEAQAAKVTLNREMLGDLLSGTALREILDPDAVADVTAQLTRAALGWRARDPEELLDLLRRFGDLSRDELALRYDGDVDGALGSLGERVAEIAGRWVSAEDAHLLQAVLEDGADPAEWLRRAALGRGIFQAAELADRYSLSLARVLDVLAALADAGTLVRGEIAPGGSHEDWVGAETLTRMHQRTLATLRRRAKPVDAAAFARFATDHQQVTGREPRPAGHDGLERALELLEGAPIHEQLVETEILPARVSDYQPALLDAALASGRWLWLGQPDKRVVFVRPENAHLVGSECVEADEVLEFLQRGGGWRTAELADAVGLESRALRARLAELIWIGNVTNDSYVPVRDPTGRASSAAKSRASLRRRMREGRPAPPTPDREGRWSAVRRREDLSPSDADAVAQIILARSGIVTRETWAADRWAVAWADVRAALARSEARGSVRRGYFVEGVSGLQYAAPWAVDAVRRHSDAASESIIAIAAADPANPWGSIFESKGVRRAAGAYVVLDGGAPLLAFAGSRVTPLSDRPAPAFVPGLAALAAQLRTRRGKFPVDAWGEHKIADAALIAAFTEAGWLRTPTGFAPRR